MPLRRPGLLSRTPAVVCRLIAASLILGAAALHIWYLSSAFALDLASDEAHYWDWSRHLDWSYYSKGPLVAWLIRASCELVGPWSEQYTGNLAFAVRLPAVICSSLLLLSLYILTVQVYRREPEALAVVGIALTLPLIAVGASIMTIDSPYTCCWGWALVLTYQAIFRGSRWAWPVAGLVIGLGILAKYTMGLFLPSVFLFLLLTPRYRRLLRHPGFWTMTAVAAVCCLPILIWNGQHHWMTFKHLGGLAGFAQPTAAEPTEGPRFYWFGPLKYLGGQIALLLGIWFVSWVGAMIVFRPTVEKDPALNYLWWLSAPMFFVFLAFSIKTDGGEVNWPVTAYLSGLVLAAAWLGRQLDSPRRWYRRCTRFNIGLAAAFGLAITLVVHHSDTLHPLLSRLTGPPTNENPLPLRKLDPTCRLRGWRTLAAAVDAERSRLQQESGEEVLLAGQSWTLPGELGIYCAGHPQAYSFGPLTGDRHSQYDLWPGPLDKKPEPFKGRTFLFVGGPFDALSAGFRRVELLREVVHYEHGQPVALWTLTICRDFRGFPVPKAARQF
jgi:hypothetical protein